jgi:hypothetical protein
MSTSPFQVRHLKQYPDTMFVIDLDATGSTPATDNAAEVVLAVLRMPFAKARSRIIHRDSTGRWDELRHAGRRFIGRAPLSPEDQANILAVLDNLRPVPTRAPWG